MPPMYDYVCGKGHSFEAQQSIKDEPLKICQERGCRSRVQRLISKVSFSLKGGGWFADGYGSSKQKK